MILIKVVNFFIESEGAQSTTFETIGFKQIIRGGVFDVILLFIRRGAIIHFFVGIQQVEFDCDGSRLFGNDYGGLCQILKIF